MQPTNDLILKFLNRECTAEEAQLVHDYLTHNPAALDKYFSEQEWSELANYKAPDEERSTNILQNILRQIEPEQEKKVFRLKQWMVSSMAACLCVFAAYMAFMHVNRQPVSQKQATVALVNLKWKAISNTVGKTMFIRLDDGSRVALAPKSSMRYTLPFKRKLRNIYLTGQGKFYVAKDKKRPFTVYAGPLATTALGTVFKITAWPGSTNTKVRLLTGKVKVVQYNRNNTKPVYLLPGKELVFNHQNQFSKVSSFLTQPVKPVVPLLAGLTTIKGDTVNFVNQQLPLVINKLQEAYHIRITATANLKKYYFTGEFNTRTEPIANVLGTITSLNKLRYTLQPDSTYIISKR